MSVGEAMARTSLEMRTIAGGLLEVASSGPKTVITDRSKRGAELGVGFNADELFQFAIGRGDSNAILPEAARRGRIAGNATITVNSDRGGDQVRAQNRSFSVVVDADASDQEIVDWIRHGDRMAEIPNSLRPGTEVGLARATFAACGKPR
jgi:hypothetical protein